MDYCSDCEIVQANIPKPDVHFKVVTVGNASVGKSCILHRVSKDEYKENYEVTMNAEYSSIFIRIKDNYIKLQLQNKVDQEGFKSLAKVFYKDSHSVILVYDVTRKSIFEKLSDWLTEIRETAPMKVGICLVGNQNDRAKEREVSLKSVQWFLIIIGY